MLVWCLLLWCPNLLDSRCEHVLCNWDIQTVLNYMYALQGQMIVSFIIHTPTRKSLKTLKIFVINHTIITAIGKSKFRVKGNDTSNLSWMYHCQNRRVTLTYFRLPPLQMHSGSLRRVNDHCFLPDWCEMCYVRVSIPICTVVENAICTPSKTNWCQ